MQVTSELQRAVLSTYYALVTARLAPDEALMPVWIGRSGGAKTSMERLLAASLGVNPLPPNPRHPERGGANLDWIGALHPPEDFNGWPTPRPQGLMFEAPWHFSTRIVIFPYQNLGRSGIDLPRSSRGQASIFWISRAQFFRYSFELLSAYKNRLRRNC